MFKKNLLGRNCKSVNGFMELQTMDGYLEECSNKFRLELEDVNELNEGQVDVLMEDNIQGTLFFMNSFNTIGSAFYLYIHYIHPIFGWFLF